MVKGELKSLRITLESVGTEILGYVYLKEISRGEVASTRKVAPDVNVDYDASGRVLGIECLHAERMTNSAMRALADELGAPELAGIDLAEMCKSAA